MFLLFQVLTEKIIGIKKNALKNDKKFHRQEQSGYIARNKLKKECLGCKAASLVLEVEQYQETS